MTRVALTVLPRTTDPADYLGAFSQRFCGDVVDAEGPPGWKVEVEREKGRSSVAADVTWERGEGAINDPGPVRFAVRLRGDWRTGLGFYIAFSESGGPAAGSPHDCPYPYR
jgi:hypothetical protein